MAKSKVTAEIISMPGQLGDVAYQALQVSVEGFQSPYVLTLALPAVGYRALSKQANPRELYEAIVQAINLTGIEIEVVEG